jgi:uncharacterized protein (TIGR03435 family)
MRFRAAVSCLALLCTVVEARSRAAAMPRQPSELTAVSIYRDVSGVRLPGFSLDASGAFRARHVTALDLVRIAYRDRVPEISRSRVLPSRTWLDVDRFNIDAKTVARATDDDLARALRAVVAERFQITVRPETREVRAYAMVLGRPGRLGTHLRPTRVACVDVGVFASIFDSARRCSTRFGEPTVVLPPQAPTRLLLGDITMDWLAWSLERTLHGTLSGGTARVYSDSSWAPPQERRVNVGPLLDSDVVINQTALEGRYDAEIEFTGVVPPSTPNFTSASQVSCCGVFTPPPLSISLFDALRDQLGVKLQSRTMPVEFLRIDAQAFPVLN